MPVTGAPRCHGHVALALVLASGCELAPEPTVDHRYEPFAGEAFPSRRAPIQLPARAGLVTDTLSDTLSIVDLDAAERVARFPVGRDPVGVDGPHRAAVDAAHAVAFTALSYPPTAASGPHAASHGTSQSVGWVQAVALDDFRVLGQVRVDRNPGDIAVSADGRRVVVTHFDLTLVQSSGGSLDQARAQMAVVDPSTLTPDDSPEPVRIKVCVAPHGVALSRPDGALAYVACYGEDALAVVDLATFEVLDRIPVAAGASGFGDPQYGPYAVTPTPDFATLVVSDTVNDDLRFFDVATRTFDPARTVPTLGTPSFPAFSGDGARLYVPTQAPDALSIVDVATGDELARRDFAPGECPLPQVAQPIDAGRLAVVCQAEGGAPGHVLVVDAETLETRAAVEVGVSPDSLSLLGAAP